MIVEVLIADFKRELCPLEAGIVCVPEMLSL